MHRADFPYENRLFCCFTSEKQRPYCMDVGLCDLNTHEVFYDKLGYKIISLPYFEKEPDELHTVMDQWIYLLKYLSTMDKMPTFLDKRIFELIFEIGEISKITSLSVEEIQKILQSNV